MAEPMRKPAETPESGNRLDMEGFEQFFNGESDKESTDSGSATAAGERSLEPHFERLIERLGEIITFSVDQRIESAKIANQLIENQRQLVATQQILIRLMERSIELTRHVTTIEEKLPAVFELPSMVEKLRAKVAQLEGVEIA